MNLFIVCSVCRFLSVRLIFGIFFYFSKSKEWAAHVFTYLRLDTSKRPIDMTMTSQLIAFFGTSYVSRWKFYIRSFDQCWELKLCSTFPKQDDWLLYLLVEISNCWLDYELVLAFYVTDSELIGINWLKNVKINNKYCNWIAAGCRGGCRFVLLCDCILSASDTGESQQHFADEFLSPLLSLHGDRVPNVRISLARILAKHSASFGEYVLDICFLGIYKMDFSAYIKWNWHFYDRCQIQQLNHQNCWLLSKIHLCLRVFECRAASRGQQRGDVGAVTSCHSAYCRWWPRRSLLCWACDIVGKVGVLWMQSSITATVCCVHGSPSLLLMLHSEFFCLCYILLGRW